MNEDGALGCAVVFLLVVVIAAVLWAERDYDANRYHTQLCAARLNAAPTSRDTLLVIRADDYCTRLVRDSSAP